jgi:subtilase family serine protease
MKKLVFVLLLAVLFLASCYPGGPITITASGKLPVINSFSASPSNISAGESSILNWTVTGATTVSIDQGIGNVALTGPRAVTPAATTVYTLTASSSAGSITATTQVMVTGASSPPESAQPPESTPPPAAGLPDLIIQGIVRSGDTVTYTIKNQGDAAAGPSTSTLLVDGATVANDSVGSLAAGESRTETFAGYTYSCTLPSDSLVVKADIGNTVVEGSEANNSYTESWSCLSRVVGPMFTLKPDLVIENIWLVHEMTGDKIYYKIKNNGSAAAGASTSELYVYPCAVPCSPKAYDSIASLAAGASRTEKFTSYNYTGLGWSVGVKVDVNGDVNESDEGNNSLDKPKADL